MEYVLRWRTKNGRERPCVETASGDDARWHLGRATKREVVEAAIVANERSLKRARESVAAYERYAEDLEKLLQRVTKTEAALEKASQL